MVLFLSGASSASLATFLVLAFAFVLAFGFALALSHCDVEMCCAEGWQGSAGVNSYALEVQLG